MNHTGECWFDYGPLDSPHSYLISKILQNMSNSPYSPVLTDVAHATTIIHFVVGE